MTKVDLNPREKWFSAGLYREGLHQLRTVGIIYLVILELGAILSYLARVINVSQYKIHDEILSIHMLSANMILCITVVIFTCIMVLYLFQFLSKRSACDFYHALPHTRACLFTSFYAAVLTWMFAGILLSFLTSFIGFICFGSEVPLIIQTIPSSLLFILTACFYLTSALVLAVSLSGTLFNNIVTAGLIIAAPRCFFYIFAKSLTSSIRILSSDFLPAFFKFAIHPLFNMYSELFFAQTLLYPITEKTDLANLNQSCYQSSLFSLIIGVLYVITAFIVFRYRRSETAGQSANSRILQTIFRLGFAMLFCLIPYLFIIDQYSNGFDITISNLFISIVLYILALCGYFLYELITTKKTKNLVRSIPALLVLFALNIGLYAGYYGARASILNKTPAADEIKGITILYGDGIGFDGSGRKTNYYTYANERIENEEVNRIISENLRQDATLIKAGGSAYSDFLVQNSKAGRYYTIKIELPWQTIYRHLFITDANMRTINEQFANH